MRKNLLRTLSIITPLFISIFLLGCVGQLGTYSQLGEKEVTVPTQVPFNWSTVRMDLQTSSGEIIIQMAPDTADYFIKTVITVKGRNGEGSVEDANTMTYEAVSDDVVAVELDSDWHEIVQNNPYAYDLEISIKKGVKLELNIEVSSGNIEVVLTEIEIAMLEVDVSSGNLEFELSNMDFSATFPKITTSSGSITAHLADVSYLTTQTDWKMSCSSGNIAVTLQQTITNTPGTRVFDLHSSSGSVTVDTTLPSDYGVNIDAHASSGSITIPGDGESYTSSNFASATTKYEFELDTSSGNIKFS